MRRKILLPILFIFFAISGKTTFGNSAFIIDHGDTIVFDISQAIVNGSQVDIPVSIHTDDTVYALDFALKFNHVNLTFDSVITHTSYIQSFYYYNPADSTLRFTSNSLHVYAVDSPLIMVRFTMLNSTIGSTDITNPLALLNGDTCTGVIIHGLPTGVAGMNVEPAALSLFPNPASDFVNLDSEELQSIEIYDMHGKLIMRKEMDGYLKIDTSDFPDGCYVVRYFQKNNISGTGQLLIAH